LLHPFGDLVKTIKTGAQSSLKPVYAASTAGNRMKVPAGLGASDFVLSPEVVHSGHFYG
jgi:hypothetical protein